MCGLLEVNAEGEEFMRENCYYKWLKGHKKLCLVTQNYIYNISAYVYMYSLNEVTVFGLTISLPRVIYEMTKIPEPGMRTTLFSFAQRA